LISIEEAKILTAIDRQQRILNELYPLIRQALDAHMAGRLQAVGEENPQRIRNQLASVAKLLGIPLLIRRRNEYVCFWSAQEEPVTVSPPPQERQRRARTPPDNRPGEELHE
jgi:hypothetical protein